MGARPLFVALALVTAPGCSEPAPASTPLDPSAALSPLPPGSAAPAPAIRYVALGDSFTAGTGASPREAFPARLTARLVSRGVSVQLENLGVNGFTTDHLLADELPRVASYHPTLVTLAIGANDIVRGSPLDRYREQVRRIFGALQAAGVPAGRVLVLPQPDWSKSPVAREFGDPRATAARITAFNAALEEEAKAAGARWVDLTPLLRRQADGHQVARDGLHPNAEAYDAWAESLFPIVTAL